VPARIKVLAYAVRVARVIEDDLRLVTCRCQLEPDQPSDLDATERIFAKDRQLLDF